MSNKIVFESLSDFLARVDAMPIPTRWGRWSYRRSNLTLVHDEGYEVDLERMETSAATLDWIAQVAGKGWATPADIGNLVLAIDDLVRPQGRLCGGGCEHGPVKFVAPREPSASPANDHQVSQPNTLVTR